MKTHNSAFLIFTLWLLDAACVPQDQQYFSPAPTGLQNAVCNPFGGGEGTGNVENGILASLTYLSATSPEVEAGGLLVSSFFAGAPGVQSEPNPIVLNQLNVPTVDFSQGFVGADGKTLEDLNGNELIEWFSLHMDAQIKLNPGDQAGNYQFGVLSDDGSILSLAPSGSGPLQDWITNDGEHSNTLGCASSTVAMTEGQAIPIHLDYFQGPRYKIALILMWRLNPASLSDVQCGVNEGDPYYFTDTASAPPVPTANYEALLNRGWTPVPAANFYLENGVTNPCGS
jgi:hypothetical protein